MLRSEGASLYNRQNGQYDLNKKLARIILEFPLVVIDGMRHPEDYTFWKEQCFLQFKLIYVDSDYKLRSNRFLMRGNETISYDKALNHPAENDVFTLKNLADYIVYNNGNTDALYADLDRIISELL